MPSFAKAPRKYNKTPSRRKIPGVGAETNRAVRLNIQASIDATLIPGATTVVTFNKPVVYSGTLPAWTMGTETVLNVTQTSATTYTFSWSGTITAADEINIPFQDPSFRDNTGGYVQPGVNVAV